MAHIEGTCGHAIRGNLSPIYVKDRARGWKRSVKYVLYCNQCRFLATARGGVLLTEAERTRWLEGGI